MLFFSHSLTYYKGTASDLKKKKENYQILLSKSEGINFSHANVNCLSVTFFVF